MDIMRMDTLYQDTSGVDERSDIRIMTRTTYI